MEQIKQLKDMRDAAQQRIEDALAAIQNSPDAKLVNSLTTLIRDLEQSIGDTNSSKPASSSSSASNSGNSASSTMSSKSSSDSKDKSGSVSKKDEMSLEDSLEAELLS